MLHIHGPDQQRSIIDNQLPAVIKSEPAGNYVLVAVPEVGNKAFPALYTVDWVNKNNVVGVNLVQRVEIMQTELGVKLFALNVNVSLNSGSGVFAGGQAETDPLGRRGRGQGCRRRPQT